MNNFNRLLGGVLLISGTSIGAGLIALPVETGTYGFLPSALILFICWLATLFAALYMLEANLWCKDDSNLISMAEETLGPVGRGVAWLSYLLLLYALMAAYLSGMNSLLVTSFHQLFDVQLSSLSASSILITLFGLVLYFGTKPLDYLNRIFILGFIVTFFALIFTLSSELKPQLLKQTKFHSSWLVLPVIVTTFGYQIIIPSVRRYLDSDVKDLVKVIIIGSTIPLAVYLIWELITLGVIPPHGTHGLDKILSTGQPAIGLTISLEGLLHAPWIGTIAKFLSFFVIATSFIGVSLSLFDFLCDGFHVHKKSKLSKLPITIGTFIPPLFFTLYYPGAFIVALGYAGILVAVLLIIMPVSMVISGRYFRNEPKVFTTPGGLFSITLLLAFALSIVVIELFFG